MKWNSSVVILELIQFLLKEFLNKIRQDQNLTEKSILINKWNKIKNEINNK